MDRNEGVAHMKLALPLLLVLLLPGCIGTVIGVTTDAAIEVAKVPFKVGGAVIDVVAGDDDDDDDDD
jgi:hypothetical protein